MSDIRAVDIYGDSVLRGVILEDGRYVFNRENNIRTLEEQFGLVVRNRAVFGCTVDKGLARLEKDLAKGSDAEAVILEFGGNDCDFRWEEIAADPESEHLPLTPPEKFKAIYCRMIELVKAAGKLPLLMTLPPISAEKYFAWFTRNGLNGENILRWLGDIGIIYRHQEIYSRAVSSLAAEYDCPCVDVRGAFLPRHDLHQLICEDGIHPNVEGHRLICRVFADFARGFFAAAPGTSPA